MDSSAIAVQVSSSALASRGDVNRIYAKVAHHAIVCHDCGHGQKGDRGVEMPRQAFPSQQAYDAAVKAAFDAGREWDGRTYVLAADGEDVRCPNEGNHGGAPSAVDPRDELAALKAQFAAFVAANPSLAVPPGPVTRESVAAPAPVAPPTPPSSAPVNPDAIAALQAQLDKLKAA